MTLAYQVFKYGIFRPLVKYYFRAKIYGQANIPAGGAILAANHLDIGDIACFPSLVDVPLVFPAKRELFHGKGIGGKIVAWFMRVTGQAAIDRSGGKASVNGLASVEKVLVDGGYVGIFPEGTRSPDGRMYKGHTGVARLALRDGKPVLPVGLINTQIVRNKLGIPVMRKAKVIIGEPMDFSPWVGQGNDHAVLRWVTNEVMAAIQQITEQSYVDVYGSRVKRGELSEEDLVPFKKATPNEGVPTPPTTAELADEAADE